MSIAAALSNLITACWVLGAIFVVVVVAIAWAAIGNLKRTLTGRRG